MSNALVEQPPTVYGGVEHVRCWDVPAGCRELSLHAPQTVTRLTSITLGAAEVWFLTCMGVDDACPHHVADGMVCRAEEQSLRLDDL